MLARSRRIALGGAEIETPLLVPAISSKAVGPIELGQGRRKPQVVAASRVHTETLLTGIRDAVLISAYDIHHGFVSSASAFHKGFAESIYASPRVLVIDSGWYEKGVGPSGGQWYHKVGEESLPFEQSDHTALIDSLDPKLEAVLVNWDSRGSYIDQIKAAQDFFGARPRFTSDILLKPEGKKRHHDFKELSGAVAGRLRAFKIVGVTEKELGDTILSRLTSLAHLRECLAQANVDAPIHVFGGLDPLMTPLYFAAGGEIFDGLSWLRYAFRDGLSVARDNAPLLDRNYEKRFPAAISRVQLSNLDALEQLATELRVFFHNNGDWGKLRRGDELRPAFEAMEASLGSTYGR